MKNEILIDWERSIEAAKDMKFREGTSQALKLGFWVLINQFENAWADLQAADDKLTRALARMDYDEVVKLASTCSALSLIAENSSKSVAALQQALKA